MKNKIHNKSTHYLTNVRRITQHILNFYFEFVLSFIFLIINYSLESTIYEF